MADTETPPEQTSEQTGVNTPAETPAPPVAQETAPPEISPVSEEPPRKGRFKYIFIALLAGLLIVAGVFAFDYISQPSGGKSSETAKRDVQHLTVGIINGPMDAKYQPDNVDSYAQSIYAQIYEGLVVYQDKTKIVPLLASGWSNPDSSTWDFQLAKDVKFSNGDPMTSADVVYSIEQAIKTPEGVYSGTIKGVKANGQYGVQITTSQPDPFLLNKLTFLMVVNAKAAAKGEVIGTGPYKLKPGTESAGRKISLVSNPTYHGGHVYTKNLTFVSEDSEEQATADLKSGKINIAGEYSSDKPDSLKGFDYQRLVSIDSSVNFIAINSVSPGPLQKLEVRQALRDSIDVPQLIKDSKLSADPSYQLVPQTIPGYNPTLSIPKKDTAKAKSLLAQAGYPKGVMLTLEAAPTNVAVARAIAAQAKDAGFTINVVEEENFDQFIEDLMTGKLQLGLISYGSDTLDGGDVFTQAVQQTENFKSAALDDYLKQAADTVDPQTRLQILQKTSKYINDMVAVVPLYSRHRVWTMDKPYMIQLDSLSASPGIYFSKVYMVK